MTNTIACSPSISEACAKSSPNPATASLDPKCFEHIKTPQKHACSACQTTLAYRESALCITCGRAFHPALTAFNVLPLA